MNESLTGLADTPDRIYAIGDVHGWLDKLESLHARIACDVQENPCASHAILHIGDYTDRGPDSRGVLDYLAKGAARGEPWINLYGNHDRMLLKFWESPGGRDPMGRLQYFWLHEIIGGATTLQNYGIDIPDEVTEAEGAAYFDAFRAAIPDEHIAFLQGLRPSYRWRDFFFAHAGVKPGLALEDQAEDDLLWIRKPFHICTDDFGATVVHGHTPVKEVEDHGNRIAIDTGAAYGKSLSCVVFDDEGIRVLNGRKLR
ncbi:MAG: metallophosphoesterase [Pikeienuella sp.]